MSAMLPLERRPHAELEAHEAPAADQFVVSHGKAGVLGVFDAPETMTLKRGAKVILQTSRGIEIGSVLCPATIRQARLLGAASRGSLLRAGTADDAAKQAEHARIEQEIFEASRSRTRGDELALEILDAEVLFDGTSAILQFLGSEENTESLALDLEAQFKLSVRLENVAGVAAPREHHCDKPDCGREAGGCTDCSTGGCSSCGSSTVDLREYFGHLRARMESRIPLA